MITEKQRIARRKGLGGSDIAGIIPCDPRNPTKTGTLSPFMTAVQVWDSKVGPDAGDQLANNEAVWWGSEEEDLVARRFTMLTGKRTVNHNFTITDGCLIANLDRLIIPEGQKIAAHHGEIRTNELFEAKTAGEEWEKSDVVHVTPGGFEILDGASGIPVHYGVQCYHYLGRVPMAERIYVGVKMAIPCGRFARTEFRVYCLERDDEIIREQDEFARAWWERHVVGGVRPEAVCENDLKILWRRESPATSVVVTAGMLDAWKRLRAAKEAVKAAEADEKCAELDLKNAMRDRENIVAPDGKTVLATWKSRADKTVETVDWEKLARAKGATEAEIKAATTTTVKPGARTFLPKFTDKVAVVAEGLDPASLPQDEPQEPAKGDAAEAACDSAA